MIQNRRYGLIILLLLFSSCEKWFNKDEKFVECNSNCYNITLNGVIVNKVTNSGIENIPLTLRWVKPMCLFCSENIIDKNVSNNLGEFNFSNYIDTSYFFNDYHLNISVPDNKNFIIFPSDKCISIYGLDDSNIENLKFEFYPKTQLQIQIERINDDVFETFIVEHTFKENFGYVDCVIFKSSSNQYTYPLNDTLNVETASDIKTYIKWIKSSNLSQIIMKDSLICKKNELNVFKIKY
ncbi:MAG: hypothetical protein AB7S48_01060 [Bacteroidales bacterium]